MNILVTGASGFIGSAVVELLLQNNHRVIACVRTNKNIPQTNNVEFHAIDFHQQIDKTTWLPLLKNVDAVINCAGILEEKQTGDFERIHVEIPKTLVAACLEVNVEKFVQLSALGSTEDGQFISSKHQFDDFLIKSKLNATVIRPSVVLSLRGSYGGTSLLRALAAIPCFILIPGNGDQKIQPILLEDVATILVKSITTKESDNKILYAVGPEVLSYKNYLTLLRNWLKFSNPIYLPFPTKIADLSAKIQQKTGIGPLKAAIWNMLKNGNVAPKDEFEKLSQALNFSPKSISHLLQNSASFVQDRWHARLYLLKPIIWLVICVVWIVSGISGLVAEPTQYYTILSQLLIPTAYYQPIVISTSILDVALGILLLFKFKTRIIIGLMLFATIAYTLILGIIIPALWLDPLGALLKNLPIITLLITYWIIEDMR